jgi:hypothetical protein
MFNASKNLKHLFLLAFAYADGLSMNELSTLILEDIDP